MSIVGGKTLHRGRKASLAKRGGKERCGQGEYYVFVNPTISEKRHVE